ncbi:MAG: guanylate kinase [Candidatus Saccharibacteria bacterium]|nr:guanylate kinase [Candidatus Saccharibacteria bacterium]
MKNSLVHLADFQKVLKDYHVSERSKEILASTKLMLLTGPTSSGRNTLVSALVKTNDFHVIVSDTTRHPRVNDGVLEQNGVEYWFRTEEEVLTDLEQGKFLEAAIIHGQQVSGVSIRELDQAHKEGKIAMTDIEIVGVDNIMKSSPHALALFVIPPSFEEWQRRLRSRGQMNDDELRRRMESAALEFAAALERPYFIYVINDTIEHAVEQVEALARFKMIDKTKQDRARNIIEDLYKKSQQLLSTLE